MKYLQGVRSNLRLLSKWRRRSLVIGLSLVLVAILALNATIRSPLESMWRELWGPPRPFAMHSQNFGRVFTSFTAMSCGTQETAIALMVGDDGGGSLRGVWDTDSIAGKASGTYMVVVPFDGPGFMYEIDEASRTAKVTVGRFVIANPAITGFEDEYHAKGIGAMLSSEEPVIDLLLREGRRAIAENASQDWQNPSWFEECDRSIQAEWKQLGNRFGYDVEVEVRPPSGPLSVKWGVIPTQTSAEAADKAEDL